METKDVINKQSITTFIIALIVSLGVVTTPALLEDELDKYYVCELLGTEEGPFIGEFARLSSSEQRAYPFLDSLKGYKDCKNDDLRAEWVPLEKYATNLNLDPYDLLQIEPAQEPDENKGVSTAWGKQYTCPVNAPCYEI